MVKHTQTIRRQQPTNCLSVFDHFVGLAVKGLTCMKDFHIFPDARNYHWICWTSWRNSWTFGASLQCGEPLYELRTERNRLGCLALKMKT